ncbi:putative transcription factor B3-Domain family [Helianthus annuus]|nr:putative transcription factor B3-Domain family [Helianthus annuus]
MSNRSFSPAKNMCRNNQILVQAYFSPINQSEGVPLKIQDIKGKEWTFQFRFWPNNNSRMYVLEGVTPCIQNMQLQAGNTVIFSRLDPEDKPVIGCRKATVLADAPALLNPVNGGDLTCTDNGNLPTSSVFGKEYDTRRHHWDSVQSSEKKKTRSMWSKTKRLHMHSEDALELKFTWEEAQEYLRPPISKPTVVTIKNCELVEYNGWRNESMLDTHSSQNGRVNLVQNDDSHAHIKKVEEVIKMMEMELGDGWIFHKDCKAHWRHYGWRSRKRSSNAGKWQLMMVGCKDVVGNLWFSSGYSNSKKK